jgi:hypothetical protein
METVVRLFLDNEKIYDYTPNKGYSINKELVNLNQN